jgi:ABC-type glycerol-3-phosphate transport system substrate-binding protein
MKSFVKKIVSLSMVCALTASMAALGTGCSSGGSSTPAETGSSNPGGAESSASTSESLPSGKKLRVWTYMQSETPTLKEYAQKWAEKTNNKVEFIYQTASM